MRRDGFAPQGSLEVSENTLGCHNLWLRALSGSRPAMVLTSCDAQDSPRNSRHIQPKMPVVPRLRNPDGHLGLL